MKKGSATFLVTAVRPFPAKGPSPADPSAGLFDQIIQPIPDEVISPGSQDIAVLAAENIGIEKIPQFAIGIMDQFRAQDLQFLDQQEKVSGGNFPVRKIVQGMKDLHCPAENFLSFLFEILIPFEYFGYNFCNSVHGPPKFYSH